MKYPTNEDELVKDAIIVWIAEMYDNDVTEARRIVKLHLAIAELKERGFSWTDI